MKDHEIIKLAERCVAGECADCPYTTEDCGEVLERTLELAKRYKAELEQPKTAGAECTVMPDYEVEYNRLSCENAKLHIQINEMREELIFLRAVKATAEAFLGREIR